MDLAGRDFDALTWVQDEVVVLDGDGELAGEDEEELAGAGVMMRGFGDARRKAFFDDVEVGGLDEVPAVAIVIVGASPGVMLGGGGIDYFGGH